MRIQKTAARMAAGCLSACVLLSGCGKGGEETKKPPVSVAPLPMAPSGRPLGWAEPPGVAPVGPPPVVVVPVPPAKPPAVVPEKPPVAKVPLAPPKPAPTVEIARKAVAAIRAAGLNPSQEVTTKSTSRAKLSTKATEAVRKAGLDEPLVRASLKAHPETLAETPEQIAAAIRRMEAQKGLYEGRVKAGWLENLPKDPGEGFGADTKGGDEGEEIAISEPSGAAVQAAFAKAAASGNCRIAFRCSGDIDIDQPLPILQKPNVTVDGLGMATLWGSAIPSNRAVVSVSTNDVIIRNLRIRHGGDNISLGGQFYDGASRVLVSHVSTTASRDDGVSAGWGARDVTLQWSFFGGCTRSIFIKYKGSTNITIHHNLIEKQMMRGPLVSGKA
ncbi:MAG: hypothetical protein AAB215_03250, partial [Planctomycetota bacterium]